VPILGETTVPSLLKAADAAFGPHSAEVEGDRSTSYHEFHQLVRRAARAYLASGIRHGDAVAIWVPNRLEFMIALLGAQYIGAVAVPLNTRATGFEARAILARARARAIVLERRFLGKDFVAMLRDSAEPDAADGTIIAGLPHIATVVDIDATESADGVVAWPAFLALGDDTADAELDAAADAVQPDDVVDMLFTSGTTGLPKGVLSAHRQTLSVAKSWAIGANLAEDDRYLIVNPLFHGFGYKAGMFSSLVAGATMYPVQTFDPDLVLEMVQRERITVLPGVPTIFTTLIDHPRRREHDLSSLRFAIAGAATVPATLFRDMVEILGFQQVAQAYGLTECVVATMSRPGEDFDHIQETTGPAVVGVEIRVVDAENRPVPAGDEGEIVLRGDNVTLGYFEDEAANRAAFDDEGWFHSGDIGRMDEHGCVKITDRLKDMIIVGGFNVYPAEVEDTLRKHPAVNESAVIGVADSRLGAVPRAYVMRLREAEHQPDAAELIEFCRTRLANYKLPREIVFVDDFPRNATGKILKTTLRTEAGTAAAAG